MSGAGTTPAPIHSRNTAAWRRVTPGTSFAYQGCVSTLVYGIRETVERDERLRTALLGVFTLVLAVAFMVLLVSDQVQAAAL